MSNNESYYTDLSAYGLLPLLRETVAGKRIGTVSPARSAVWAAFHKNEADLTPLQKLILKTGLDLLEAHEQEIQTLQLA